MRQLQVLVDDDTREAVAGLFDAEGVDYVRQEAWIDGRRQWLFSAPVPSDAIGYLLGRLDEAGVDNEQYTVIGSLESAITPHDEALQNRFASDFDPLTQPELRSKAKDMSSDPTSFLSMIFLSAVIAVVGLLMDSPAIVVGSMVIAPIVGPVLTATVGAVTGDRRMLLDSIWLQAGGLAVAVAGAALFSGVVYFTGFMPQQLAITSIELIGVRLSPGLLSVTVGLAAGAAGAFGLTTKGPTSLIGVMIAAALIPAAATTGIAVVWRESRLAVGSLLLLVVTMVLINLGAFLVLVAMGYRPDASGWLLGSASRRETVAVVSTAVAIGVVVGTVGVGTAQQMAFDRQVATEVDGLAQQSDYRSVDPVAVRTEYSDDTLLGQPETVTVHFAYTGSGDPPAIAAELEARISTATGEPVTVRTRFTDYNRTRSFTESTTTARLAEPLPQRAPNSPVVDAYDRPPAQ
ncbi:DUF389 domain-containing protein [Halohasta salina]|uniref:DUF389 domain-containing protein n=1 Tax=Halohasta salina TaxID=2961621 RepID=UPI0020A56126|nr:DUF389 domain-containing protein [Halohasta salina]